MDERFESGPGRFEEVTSKAAVQFPTSVPSNGELAAQRQANPPAQNAAPGQTAPTAAPPASGAAEDARQAASRADSAKSRANVAFAVGIVGALLGACGLLVGIYGLTAPRRAVPAVRTSHPGEPV